MAEVRINITTDAKGAVTGIKLVGDETEKLGRKAAAAKTGVGQFGKGVQSAAQEFATFNPAAARAASLLGGFGPAGLTAAAGIGAVVGAAVVGVGHIVELGDQITTLSAKTGLSTDFLQELGHATQQLDVPFETAARSISKLQVNLGKATVTKETTDALRQMGLSLQELRQLAPERQFEVVAKALSEMRSQTEQAAAAQAVFGRGGIELLPLLRGNYAELMDQAHSLGIVLDEELLEAGDNLGENWELLTKIGKSLLAETVSPLTEGLVELTNFIIEARVEGNEWEEANKDLIDGLSKIQEIIGQGFPLFQNWVAEVGRLVDQIKALKAVYDTFGLGAIRSGIGSLPPPPRAPVGPPRPPALGGSLSPEELKKIEQQQAKDLKAIEAAQKAAGKAAAEATKIYNSQIVALKELDQAMQALVSGMGLIDAEALGMAESWASTDAEIRAVTAGMEEIFVQQAKVGTELGFHLETWEELQDIVDSYPEGVGDIEGATQKLEDAQQNYNQALAAANDIAQLLGGTIGSIVGQTLAAAASLSNLKNIGGTFSSASEGAGGGFLGALAGAGAVAGALAPLIGPITAGIKALFSIGGPDIGRDVGRDIGAGISQGLEETIEKSGLNAQFFLKEIFAEGGLGIDRFAEEVGDLFSMFERGEISEEGLIGELRETLPILIEHFQELGPEGQMQLKRIIDAAKEAGLSFEELGEIIALTLDDDEVLAIVEQLGVTKAAADALGISFDQLGEKIQSIFAPETLETLAENFGKTTEEMRQILADLGINVQTDLERLAAEAGLTVEDFKALGAALEEETGIPAEQLSEFLKQTGQSAEALAATLGVDISESLGTVNEEAAGAAAEIGLGADAAARLADELGRAAFNASQIKVSGIPDGGGGIPTTGAQHGFHGDVVGPHAFVIESGVRERVDIGPSGSRASGGGTTFNINITGGTIIGSSQEFRQQVAAAVKEAQRPNRNTSGLSSALRR